MGSPLGAQTSAPDAQAGPTASPDPTSPSFWVERDAESLRADVDLRPLADEAWRKRLRSGLATVLAAELVVREHEGGRVRGRARRVLRVRWDLWRERMVREGGDAGEVTTTEWPSLEAFLADFLQFRGSPLANHVPLDETVYRLDATVEMNPWGLSVGGGAPLVLDGTPTTAVGMFDTVLSWAEAWRPGRAERRMRASGHPFRGDRLPSVPAGAGVTGAGVTGAGVMGAGVKGK